MLSVVLTRFSVITRSVWVFCTSLRACVDGVSPICPPKFSAANPSKLDNDRLKLIYNAQQRSDFKCVDKIGFEKGVSWQFDERLFPLTVIML